jgi:transcriptional regulator NrdR family protein
MVKYIYRLRKRGKKMAHCPNCGSSAQVKVESKQYREDEWGIEVIRYCICGCGETFTATSHYINDRFEIIKPFSRKRLQEQLFGKG